MLIYLIKEQTTKSRRRNGDPEDMVQRPNQLKDRRRYPRSMIELPLEYRVMDAPHAHGGLVVNVSEKGLLIHSIKDMPVGLKLNVAVLFPKGYELSHFDVSAEIIWKDYHLTEDWEGYVYGLRFTQILREDRWKLKELLNGPIGSDKVSPHPRGESQLSNRGFTLIEVLIGLIILAIGLLAIAGMQISSTRGNFSSKNLTQANYVAQDGLESLEALDFSSANLQQGSHGDGSTSISGVVFNRSYTVVDNSGRKTITYTVTWSDGTAHNISFSTIRSQ